MDVDKLKEAHKHSDNHKLDISLSDKCGCFYCLNHFEPSEIKEWIDGGQTALCPRCGIDSVIAGNTGYLEDEWFFSDMHNYWFRRGTSCTMKNGEVVKEEEFDGFHKEVE